MGDEPTPERSVGAEQRPEGEHLPRRAQAADDVVDVVDERDDRLDAESPLQELVLQLGDVQGGENSRLMVWYAIAWNVSRMTSREGSAPASAASSAATQRLLR